MLKENKIPENAIKGTGKGGRISKEDVNNYLQNKEQGKKHITVIILRYYLLNQNPYSNTSSR